MNGETLIEEKNIRIGEMDIHYAVAGSGAPLLLIHGLNFGWKQWLSNIPELATHYRVYAIDLPSSGESSTIDLRSLEPTKDHVELVEEFIKQLDIPTPHVIGHSVGGWVALQIAKRKKVSVGNIVAVGPFGFPAPFSFEQVLLSFLPAVQLLTKTALSPTRPHIESFLRAPLGKKYATALADSMVDYYFASVQKSSLRHPLFLVYTYTKMLKLNRELRLLPENLKDITNKVLVVVGAEDPYISASGLGNILGVLPLFTLQIFQDSGHIPSLEEPKRFNQLVLTYMQ